MPAIPKRSEERRRVNKVPDLERAPGATEVRIPPASKDWHRKAADWYRSLAKSGQSRWYEPSDWLTAWALADQLSKMLEDPKPNAALLTAWMNGIRDLMVTEGARRRLHVELTRDKAAPAVDPVATDVDNIISLAVARA